MNRKSRKSRKIRKASLVLGIAVAALSIGVPTALAEGRMVGTQEPDGVAFFKANEMSTLSQRERSRRPPTGPATCRRRSRRSGASAVRR